MDNGPVRLNYFYGQNIFYFKGLQNLGSWRKVRTAHESVLMPFLEAKRVASKNVFTKGYIREIFFPQISMN